MDNGNNIGSNNEMGGMQPSIIPPSQPFNIPPPDGFNYGKHSIGDWISRSFNVVGAKIKDLSLLGIGHIAISVASAWLVFSAFDGVTISGFQDLREDDISSLSFDIDFLPIVIGIIGLLLLSVAALFLGLATTHVLYARHKRVSSTLNQSIDEGFSATPRYLGWLILYRVAALLIIGALVGFGYVLIQAMGGGGIAIMGLVSLGVAGVLIWLWPKLAFTEVAAIATERGVSIPGSSFVLSTGRFGAIFGRLIVMSLLVFIPSSIAGQVSGGSVTGFAEFDEVDGVSINGVPIEQVDVINLGDVIGFSDVGFVMLLVGSAMSIVIAWVVRSATAALYIDYGGRSKYNSELSVAQNNLII